MAKEIKTKADVEKAIDGMNGSPNDVYAQQKLFTLLFNKVEKLEKEVKTLKGTK